MGRTYLFECAKCGYRAKVAGGVARGFHLAVQTIACLDCRELHDVVTELKVPELPAAKRTLGKLTPSLGDAGSAMAVAPSFPAALNRLRPAGGRRFGWVLFKAVCPVSTFHRIREWNQPGRCPRCGVFLEGGAIPFKIWD